MVAMRNPYKKRASLAQYGNYPSPDIKYEMCWEEGKMVGVREVLGVLAYPVVSVDGKTYMWEVGGKEWQAKLKEWGIYGTSSWTLGI